MAILAPSLLSADFSRLKEMVETIENAGSPWLHLDIMDYHFVPNLTFGAGIVKAIRPYSKMIFDAHFMVTSPEKYIADFKKAGADYFTFHLEAADDPKALISKIKEAGMKVGISVKPKTPVETLKPYLEEIDLVLVMSVEPGFGGQKFMADMLPKVTWLKEQRQKYAHSYLIEIDGGINQATAKEAIRSGVDVLVAGTAVFGEANIEKAVKYYLAL